MSVDAWIVRALQEAVVRMSDGSQKRDILGRKETRPLGRNLSLVSGCCEKRGRASSEARRGLACRVENFTTPALQ